METFTQTSEKKILPKGEHYNRANPETLGENPIHAQENGCVVAKVNLQSGRIGGQTTRMKPELSQKILRAGKPSYGAMSNVGR